MRSQKISVRNSKYFLLFTLIPFRIAKRDLVTIILIVTGFYFGSIQQSFAQQFVASVAEIDATVNEPFQVSFTFSGPSINNA